MIKNDLQDMRYKYKMSQKEFASLLDVDYNQYNLWENNKYNPNLETAIRIALKLNKHVDDIFYIVDS